ncbi:RNA-dependent RNA polymerase [Ceratobasidium sp. AG-Ba]|nr:RNA-dependent RNA polymerase [Ceratobasidium sp. AG-Ba]
MDHQTSYNESENRRGQLQNNGYGRSQEQQRKPQPGQPRLKAIEFGVQRNNTFLAEYSKDLAQSASYLTFENDKRMLRAILWSIDEHDYSSIFSVGVSAQSVEWVGIGYDGADCYMLLHLNHHPTFEQTDSATGNYRNFLRRVRLSRLDEEHGRVAPYTSRSMKLVFHEDSPTIPTESTCSEAGLPNPELDPEAHFDNNRRAYSQENIEAVEGWLRGGSLPWEVAFQCEALFRNGSLIPKEIMLLRTQVEQVAGESPARACQALKTLRNELKTGVKHPLSGFEDEGVITLFQAHITMATQETTRHPQRLASTFLCHYVNVTPTAAFLDGPYVEPSNLVIRRYPGFDSHFIRVNINDEGEGKIRFKYEDDLPDSTRTWIGRVLKTEGIALGDRRYKLLGYRFSGLRDSNAFFSSEFMYEGASITPDFIRASLGEFPRSVTQCPARYGARMAQAFSATDPSIILSPENIHHIPDIITDNGEIFSSGCGTISRALADKVWKGWLDKLPHLRRKQRHKDEPTPSAFQMRIGGCKGVVRIDPKLTGEQLHIRPSMKRFEAPDELGFEIIRTSERPDHCFLNRAGVMLLCTNGVDASVFENLMENALQTIDAAYNKLDGVKSIFTSNRLGGAFQISKHISNLSSLGLELNQRGVQSAGLRKLIETGIYCIKLGLKHRARIEVPNSYTLVGVCDEEFYLKPREIYVCIRKFDHKTGNTKKEFIKGWVTVSRSTCIHPGHFQRLYAIGEPPADSPFVGEDNHLPNCIVFSSLGPRPVPDMLGGGDLDGDVFNIITLPELIPPLEYPPPAYPPIFLKVIPGESTIEDIADFMIDYICNDVVGLIAANNVSIASTVEDGTRNPDCLANAELHAMAIDFFSTGVCVPFEQIRKPRYTRGRNPMNGVGRRPDWQAGREQDPNDGNHYRCESVLGKLYRAVEMPSRNPAREETVQANDYDKSNAIFKALAGHVAKYQSEIKDIYTAAAPWVQILLDHYTTELDDICMSHTIARGLTDRLSEVEIMLGTNLDSPDNRILRDRMKLQTENLVDYVRLKIQGETDEDPYGWLARAWRAYTLTFSIDYEKFGTFSFSWIALGSVFDALRELDPEFLVAAEPDRPLFVKTAPLSESTQARMDGYPQSDRENWTWIEEPRLPPQQHTPVQDLVEVAALTLGKTAITALKRNGAAQTQDKDIIRRTKGTTTTAIGVGVVEGEEGEEGDEGGGMVSD